MSRSTLTLALLALGAGCAAPEAAEFDAAMQQAEASGQSSAQKHLAPVEPGFAPGLPERAEAAAWVDVRLASDAELASLLRLALGALEDEAMGLALEMDADAAADLSASTPPCVAVDAMAQSRVAYQADGCEGQSGAFWMGQMLLGGQHGGGFAAYEATAQRGIISPRSATIAFHQLAALDADGQGAVWNGGLFEAPMQRDDRDRSGGSLSRQGPDGFEHSQLFRTCVWSERGRVCELEADSQVFVGGLGRVKASGVAGQLWGEPAGTVVLTGVGEVHFRLYAADEDGCVPYAIPNAGEGMVCGIDLP